MYRWCGAGRGGAITRPTTGTGMPRTPPKGLGMPARPHRTQLLVLGHGRHENQPGRHAHWPAHRGSDAAHTSPLGRAARPAVGQGR